MNIKPRKGQILIQQDEIDQQSKYGIYSPSNVEKEQKAIGVVIAIGSEIEDIKKGDRVIFGVFAGEKITIKNKDKDIEYMLLFDDDVLAIIN